MGFSLFGLVIAVAVLSPNLLMLRFPPRSSAPDAGVPALLAIAERLGQALCLVVPVITAPGSLVWLWLLPGILALAGYYTMWARYLLRGRRLADLYAPVAGVPVPMAVLPVLVFAAGAGWLSNPWMAAAAAALAATHVPAALIIARSIRAEDSAS